MKKLVGTMTAAFLISSAITTQALADDNSDDKQPELKDDIITYGDDLNSQQKDDVKEKLGAKDSYKSYDVSVNDVEKFTGVGYDHIYSSSVIEPKTFGKGVNVDIVTPHNITKVTEEQYTNAAISAGIQNAKIRVASTVEPTTGDGALTGIVKAYAESGNDLNEEDVKNANQEMSDLSDISEQNKDDDGYSDAAMNNAVADMKEQVADEKEKNGDVSDDKIQSIVDKSLKDNGLDNAINDNQRNQLYGIIGNVAKSQALHNDPKAFKKQVGKLQGELKKNHGDLIDKAKDKAKSLNTEHNRNILEKIWDAIVGFFQWLWNLVTNLF